MRVPPLVRVPAVTRVPVLVCGERERGDDAAGPAAIALLPDDVRAAAEIVEVGQLDLLALLELPAGRAAVVVDAVAGITPGEVWVRPLSNLADRATGRAGAAGSPEPRSSHELPLDQVLGLAATLRDGPPAGTFVGLGGARWDQGAPLSPAVRAALPAFALAIAAAVREAGGARDAGAGRGRRAGPPGAKMNRAR